MKTLLLFLAAVSLAALALYAAEDLRTGVWTAEIRKGRLDVTLVRGQGSYTSFPLQLSALGTADIMGEHVEVAFDLDRAAGTMSFRGRFSKGMGAGHFTFAPKAAFVRDMQALGFSDLTDKSLVIFTTHDFEPKSVRELRQRGYDVKSRREVEEAAIFRISAATVDEYARLGFVKPTWRELVHLRIGNVDGRYLEALRARGYTNLSAKQVSQLGIMGVTPEYIDSLRAAGYDKLTPKQLEQMKAHGVTPEYIRSMQAATQ